MDWVSIATAIALALIPILGTIGLWLLRRLLKNLEDQRQKDWLIKAAKGAAYILDKIAEETENKIDDAIAEALKEIAAELGKDLDSKEELIAKAVLRKEHIKRAVLKNGLKIG